MRSRRLVDSSRAIALAVGLIGCRRSPAPAIHADPSTHVASPSASPSTSASSIAALSPADREALCVRAIKARRAHCDPAFASFEERLVLRCAAEQPLWRCAEIGVDDFERCQSGADASACTRMRAAAERCRVPEQIREQCPLVIERVEPGGAADAAGLIRNDRIVRVGEARMGAEDGPAVQKAVRAWSGGPPLAIVIERYEREETKLVSPIDGRIGVHFTTTAACARFVGNDGVVPCKVE